MWNVPVMPLATLIGRAIVNELLGVSVAFPVIDSVPDAPPSAASALNPSVPADSVVPPLGVRYQYQLNPTFKLRLRPQRCGSLVAAPWSCRSMVKRSVRTTSRPTAASAVG